MTTGPGRPREVYFFGTCLIDLLFPQAGLCAMRLLQREGVRVIFPEGQSCCGQPAYNAGYRDEARAVAGAQLRALSRDIPVVVPSGSCAGMLRHHYPYLFAGTAEQERAQALASRTHEFSAFLVEKLEVRLEDRGPPCRVALHGSCSARREVGAVGAAESLLDQLRGVTRVEFEHSTECCGFGGTFSVKQPEISAAMAKDKTRAIRASGADTLVSQDCGCLMHLGGTFARQGDGPQIRHLAEFLWERVRD
jgi:L-lactate dehydrogenase complex protein LldE